MCLWDVFGWGLWGVAGIIRPGQCALCSLVLYWCKILIRTGGPVGYSYRDWGRWGEAWFGRGGLARAAGYAKPRVDL